MKSRRQSQPPKGFTLLELVLALAIAGMVIFSIFMVARGSIQSTTTMIDAQNEEISHDAFFSMMAAHFEGLPGNAVMDLRATNSSEPYTSEMTFQNTPVSFNWGGVPIAAEAMRIITVPTINKGVDIVIQYFDVQILDDEEEGTLAERGIEPIAEITLLEDVRLFEWSVLDGRNYANTEEGEWPYEWDQATRRPTFVELKVIFTVDDPPVKRMFWIPTKTNPRTVMTQLQNAARQAVGAARAGSGGGGGGGGDGAPTIPPTIRPPEGPRGDGEGGRRGGGGGRVEGGRGEASGSAPSTGRSSR